jgi:hypothetical protein
MEFFLTEGEDAVEDAIKHSYPRRRLLSDSGWAILRRPSLHSPVTRFSPCRQPISLVQMSEQDSSSRFWRNNTATRPPNARHSSEKLKVKSPLNSLATVFGFRPKKSPTLTIEDPPLPIQAPPLSDYARVVGNRPPSKSISSTVSRAESSEPKTPSDNSHNVARHSLLTLSDTDPFAPRGIVTIASPSDPTRLSAYSNHSGPDVVQPKTDDRMSYASSSSHSHGPPPEFSPSMKARSPISPPDSFTSRRLFNKCVNSISLCRTY